MDGSHESIFIQMNGFTCCSLLALLNPFWSVSSHFLNDTVSEESLA